MLKLVIGVVIGFVVASVGFTGVVGLVDRGIDQVRAVGSGAVTGDLDRQVNQARDAVREATR